jgi:predicted PhzF superfamily epimerase YddE/YHI9
LQKVELPSSADVERVKPQFHKMMDFHGRGGVIITALAPEDSEYDFVSRFFCPKAGISEDPATGSAHCTLGPYWASKLGKKELKAFQASERGAKILVKVDEDAGRVYLQGGAVLVMAGVLLNTMAS